MRRTYRSKKDMAGALDHRDMMQNIDEKSSIFSAYYIQNIKQTKRELSNIGSSCNYGVASNKVRKRKYVKRVVKEVETVKEDFTTSATYLTPERSIRVNKAYDPFDMLLMSSPACQPAEKEKDMIKNEPIRAGKTYVRKKPKKVKKVNYSSSDSYESEKENSSISITNKTDILTHELLIEKAPSCSPKYFDESINKIVNNLSLLNNYRKKTNTSFNTSFKYKNRLTKNLNSPLPKSPLCSTPFKDKYRGKSIYNFSPITTRDESLNYVTITEEDNTSNNSIILVSHSKMPKVKEYVSSPVTHKIRDKTLSDKSARNNSKFDEKSLKNDRSIVYDKEDSVHANIKKKSVHESKERNVKEDLYESIPYVKEDSLLQEQIPDSSIVDINSLTKDDQKDFLVDKCQQNSETSFLNPTVLQLTDAEPFLGFPIEEIEPYVNDSINLSQSYDNIQNVVENKSNSIDNSNTIDMTKDDISVSNDSNNDGSDFNESNKSKNDSDDSMLQENDPDNFGLDSENESMYDTCNSDQISSNKTETESKEPIVAIERMSDSIFFKYYNTMQAESENAKTDNESDSFTSEDNEMEYKASIVAVERMNDSVLMRYYDKMQADSDNGDDDIVPNKSKSNVSDNSMSTEPEIVENKANEIVITDSSTTEDVASSNDDYFSNSEEENEPKCVSFVTTRRRNDYTNDSMFIFDNSYGSSSTDCDKTVLSNKIKRSIELDSNAKDNGDLNEDDEIIMTGTDKEKQETSRITIRKSSRVTRQANETEKTSDTLAEIGSATNKYNSDENTLPEKGREMSRLFRNSTINPMDFTRLDSDAKPGIVLKPGKKWERSLSIYKRMTMADSYDMSILEDENEIRNKGRKYRQSVISTMEMQDSLHNESLNSRRSTFVSKPNRSLVRFVIDSNKSRVSLNSSTVYDDLKGFLHEECDDTVIELSKLSLVDSEHEVTVLETFHDSERITTAKDFVLRRCNQTDPILFDECYPEPLLKNCHKIGEGVYGEVFLWRGRDARARVMKIVPIAGHVKVNGEVQKDFHEIISEIVIAMELSALRAPIADIDRLLDEGKGIDALDLHTVENATDVFNEVLAVRCVYGPYPARLLDLWELFDECRGSENDNPAALPADQRYLVLELANAGADLESYAFSGAHQAHALFQQIAFGLAVAEEAFQFEHRDLHWGNVLIAQTEQEFATFVLRGRVYRMRRCGVAATIIDYSLSRITTPEAILYNDLATDEQLFDAVGDYQFQVYRLMRDNLGNDWKNFEPYTNILWLHYTVDKMITALRYKRTNTKIHKQYIEKLKGIKERILEYGSATLYVLTDPEI